VRLTRRGFTALASLLSAPLAAVPATVRQCLTVLYPYQPDVRFDFDYYRIKHLGMMRDWFGAAVGAMQIRKGIRQGDGTPPAFIATVTIEILSMEGFNAASKEHFGKLIADLPNFSSVPPVGQIEEIVE